jgi:low temperature requirement protein LtrA
VLAIVIPHAFARRSDAVTFGVAYLLINLIHAFLYVTAAGGSSAEAMRQLAPWNLGTATAVIVGGLLGGLAQELIWTAIPVLQWFLLGARTGGGWELRPGYFVERHGQLILIAIGESVVATGVGASARLGVSLTLVLMVTLGLLVSAALWWTYFGEGDEQLERELAARDPRGRVQVAIRGFGYSHYAMLLAVVVISAGIRQAVEFPHLGMNPAHAFALAGGAALFIAADGWFRVTLGLRRIGRRELGALSLLLAVPLAVYLAAWVGLAATAVLIMAAITSERRQLATGREQV